MSADPAALRSRLVVGSVQNAVFAAVGGALLLLQNLLVMRLLGPAEIGLFAVAAAAAFLLEALSDFGLGDGLVQVRTPDLQKAFDAATTAAVLLGVAFWLAIVIAAPLLARFYEMPRLTLLVAAMSYTAIGGLARLPLSLLSRELRYFELRVYTLLGRVAGLVVTITLLWLGAGVWALISGGGATLLATCVPAWWRAALVPRWRFSVADLRPLMNFGWPFWTARALIVAVDQGSVLLMSSLLSFQALGQFRSAEQLASLAVAIDILLRQTMFPVLCRVSDSVDETRRVFVGASRLALTWGAGVGMAMFLFADDLVRFVLSDRWQGAQPFLRVHGLAVIIGTVAYSWDALYMARGRTVPLLRYTAIYACGFFVVFPPLVYGFGRTGAIVGVLCMSVIGLLARHHYLRQLGCGIAVSDIVVRPALCVAFAATAAVLVRTSTAFGPTASFLLCATTYLATYGLAIFRIEGSLLTKAALILAQSRRKGA